MTEALRTRIRLKNPSTKGMQNVLTNNINCDVLMSMFKCNLKLSLWHNELVLNYPK